MLYRILKPLCSHVYKYRDLFFLFVCFSSPRDGQCAHIISISNSFHSQRPTSFPGPQWILHNLSLRTSHVYKTKLLGSPSNSSIQFSHSAMSDSLWPHGLHHARLPYPSPTPRCYSKLISVASVMPSNHLILCRPLLLLPSIFPSIRDFSSESVLHIR